MNQSIAVASGAGEFLQRDDLQLPIYSVTKSYIAASVVAAKIDIECPISTWVDAALVPRAADITVRQLLNHTSGLRDYGALPAYAAAIEAGEIWTDQDFAEHTLARPLLFEPGTRWSYSNPGYWLLSQVVQRETGLSFDGYLKRFVIEPLALERTQVALGQFADDLPNYPADWVWHGLLLSTAADVVTFMTSHLVKPLVDRHDLIQVPVQHPAWTSPSWGCGLMVDPGIKWGHNGDGPKYSAACFHDIKKNLTACVLCRTDIEGDATTRTLDLIKRWPA